MRKTYIRFVLALTMIATSVLFGIKINNINTSPEAPSQSSDTSSYEKIVLKINDGLVSLFKGEKILETFSEINFTTLPPADRDMLEEGIELSSIDDAYRLIEDFDG